MNRPWVFPLILLILALGSSAGDVQSHDRGAAEVRPIQARRTSDAPKTRFYIQTSGVDETDVIVLRKRLIAEGAERVNLFAPSKIIVCEAPESVDLRAIVDDPRFTVTEEALLDARLRAGLPETADLRLVRDCYERALRPPAAPPAEAGELGAGVGFDDVVRVVPPEVVEISRARAALSVAPDGLAERNIQQNSEFLAGDVLCQIVCPESDGNAENWTDRMLADASSGAYAALLDFQSKFVYASLHYVLATEYRVPTTYEPIATAMNEHNLWITESMHNLGIPRDQSAILMVHEFNNRRRNYYGTDWVFTAFVANSENDDDHRFADGFYTAYAMLGGPYLVIPMPSGENPFDIDPWLVYSTIFQHEMAHVFWALDEYPGPNNLSSCSSHTGYLNYSNKNKVEEIEPGVFRGCPGMQPQLCIMWRAKEDHGRPVCRYTQGQIGVIDDNWNSVPDVFDAPPTVVFANADEETIFVPDVTVAAKAVSEAVPNANPYQGLSDRVSYAAPLKDAHFSIDGLGSIFITPVDGKWDEVEEDLSISIKGIPVGLTRIGITVRNTYGRSAMGFKSIYFPGIRFALFGADPYNDGSRNVIRVSWNTVGEVFGARFDLHRIDISGGGADTTCLAENVPHKLQTGGRFRYFQHDDVDISPGGSYLYFVKSYFQIERDGQTIDYQATSDTFGAQSIFPIQAGQLVSQASPNPFGDKTHISIRMPGVSTVSANGASSVDDSQAGITLSVTIFDVAGRRVRTVYDGRVLDSFKTVEWDGTNEDNERVPSGLYFIKTVAGGGVDVKKVVVLR